MPTAMLAACAGSSYSRLVSVNPPDASVYINGVKVGKGDKRPQTFDFSQVGRIYVQATHPDYQPETEWFTLEKIEQMIADDVPVRMTLTSR
ncbi:MAG: PEGA domain-containing protein [Planctomycetes bacterium]|nr:PEGA domain-containing protein [Planctomycetota bacterium]